MVYVKNKTKQKNQSGYENDNRRNKPSKDLWWQWYQLYNAQTAQTLRTHATSMQYILCQQA
jgi:hypothetical protein